MNLFLCCLTQPAPSSNYRGESEQNRAVVQKITIGQNEYPVISPEAIRNALREMFQEYGLECNREREHNDDQLAVRFKEVPHPEKFIDDFYFGYLVANRKEAEKGLKERKATFRYKRDSVIRNNLAVGLVPYRYETLFTQSPKHTDDSPWKNAGTSQLLHRELTYTRYQYPIALNLRDCQVDPANSDDRHNLWFSYLMQALSELNGVAGNHARSYFEMAPVSVIARLTDRLASGFPLYPFAQDGTAGDLLRLLAQGDLAAKGFVLGGELVREMKQDEQEKLSGLGVSLHRTTDAAFDALSKTICGLPLPRVQVPA